MSYLAVKHLHMTFAALSGLLFLVRGSWMLADSGQLQRRWVKVVPHVIDTVLLASAVTLAVMSGQYPGAQNWLSAKVIALLVYIGLGAIAIKPGRSKGVRTTAFFAALAVFAYIVKLAVTKQLL